MATHMPHMGYGGRGLAIPGRRGKSAGRLLIVPEMDSVMVGRVHRRLLQDLVDQGVHCNMAGDPDTTPGALPHMAHQESPRLEIGGKLLDDAVKRIEVILPALFLPVILLAAALVFLRPCIQEGLEGADIHALTLAGIRLELLSLLDELAAALLIVRVCHGHSPIAHCQLRLQCSRLPEAPFRLEIPEAVQLAHTLVDKGLHPGILRADRESHPPGSLHQVGALSGPLVEGLAMVGVPLRDLFTFGRLFRRLLGKAGIRAGKKEGKQDTELYNRASGQAGSR